MYRLDVDLFLNSAIQIILEICLLAIIVLCGVVTTIKGTQTSKRFFLTLEYSSRNNNDVLSCARAINRDQFKVSMSNNNFVRGYRTFECPILTLCIKEYDCVSIKTFKTCSRDQIYTELIHEDDAIVLVEVIVELDKFAWIQLL